MFVVDAAVLLPYPPHVVARVVERVHALPRWCAGLRRVRHVPLPFAPPGADGLAAPACVFTYAAADVRLTLLARTVARGAGGPPGRGPRVAPGLVEHAAEGDGVTFGWTFALEPEPAGAPGARDGLGAARTRLRARTSVTVDPDHPTATVRAALCRQVARRAPADLERLRALLERYEFGKAPAAGAAAPGGAAAAPPALQ
jgi:hypothetical protein